MKKIADDIKKSEYKQVYLLYGTENYLKRVYRDSLKKGIMGDGDDMNYSYYEGKQPDVADIAATAETLPFFADRRLIVVENSGLFKSGGDELADVVKNLCDTTIIVFIESEVDKRCRLFKAVADKGYASEFKELSEDELVKWVFRKLKDENLNITKQTMQLFLSKTGNSMENINNELEKLLCYVMGREVVMDEDVEAVCIEQPENRVFEMVTAISQKNQKKALDLYYDLLALKEPPLKILFLIARQFNQLLMVKELSSKGFSANTIGLKIGVPSYIAGKLMTQAGAFKSSMLRGAIETCTSYEEAVKTGRMEDRMALEMLILKYSA